MDNLSDIIYRLPEYKSLEKAVSENRSSAATGLTGIHKANVITALCRRLSKKALVLVGEEQEAVALMSDTSAMGLNALFYPIRDFSFREMTGKSREYEHKRLMVLSNVLKGNYDVVFATIDAAAQFTMPPETLKRSSYTLKVGAKAEISEIAAVLQASGYERYEQVEGEGQYAVRGGILDLFMPDEKAPFRVEFWDDEVDTINYFDVMTQRRTDYVEEIHITPSTEMLVTDKNELAEKIKKKASALRSKGAAKAKEILKEEAEQLEQGIVPGSIDKFITLLYGKGASLFDYFSSDSLFFVSEHTRVKERMNGYSWQFTEDMKDYVSEGVLCKGFDNFFLGYNDICARLAQSTLVYLDNFTSGSYDTPLKELINFTVKHTALWGGSVKLLMEDLEPLIYDKYTVVVLAGTQKAADSLREELAEKGLKVGADENVTFPAPGKVFVLPGAVSAGVIYPQIKFALISQGHIRSTGKKKSLKRPSNARRISELSELSNGDFVVHNTYGIGQFQGIHKIEFDGVVKDYIKIEYAKSELLYVPVTQLDLVSKYIGPKDGNTVKLNNLSSRDWQRTKTRVRKAVRDMAQELIKLYSERMQVKGYAFSEDNEWQRDFEAKFEYEETQDQLRCIDEIKNDMERIVPMDRLLCGDVGFGKTEVALRAAFKCVTESKQCVLLAPTTILAWQHYQTALRRFEGFPVNIELLSRFRTPKQQAEILEKLKRGEIDFIIGTHRLIQKDVQYRDLGLAIIDEEQRFGVAQKERFKDMFHNVDILTLSATPIPRTLNMAMSGIRDMSVIEEAPLDRKPVQTYVLAHDEAVINEAIRRELRRGGQVFYLFNRVEQITEKAAKIQKSIPEANVAVGHGKMSENELSEVWRQMLEQEVNVLVCTTIIETGVDLPNANTLIIENADHMGLSQLHQLRGRVGRSTRRAYAYLTYKPEKVLTEISEKRLTAIREFTEFGSGFKIALRDLELRGAGSILGGQQHGHLEDVGYDMYIKMLNEAMSIAKGETQPKPDVDCLVDLNIQAHIPDKYIESLNQRLEVYRRIADIRSKEDAGDVIDELIDRFGDVPKEVMGLIDISLIRNLAMKCGIYEIRQLNSELRLFFADKQNTELRAFAKKNAKRVAVNTDRKPYILMKRNKGETVLSLLKASFGVAAAV
ncbi:MAG: transcription-repair coupling factor [Clostridia bacterium]|nr:transcription-repair coupling factor [Clostridia bacterium]